MSLDGIQETDAAWFAINTYTGHENRVRDALDLRIRNMDAEDQFVELTPERAGAVEEGHGREAVRAGADAAGG